MKDKWYQTDWFTCILAALAIAITIIGNYLIHGGHISW